MRRLTLFLLALGLGAFAYSLLRTERGSDEAPEPSAAGPPDEPAPRRCAAVTASGRRCTREAEPGSEACWQHSG